MRMGCPGSAVVTPLLLLLLVLVVLVDPGEGCGRNPIRGSGRRRRPRRLTPLVFKQHVPNVSENTLGASGLEDGRIRHSDAKFKDLAKNNNPDILFKNEEGTEADRMMSQRCKQKLNTLAISVINQWPGVKLRVTEAWDEDNMHADNSLHYEGRAVDVTTSDRDRSKYGMLARLAVEAGFDWVYYESRGHIHCSVKSDSSVAIKIGGCFPADSHVIVPSGGTIAMTNLEVGHRVLAMNSQGHLVYSDVIGFLDRSASQVALFYTLTTDEGHRVTLTAKHLLHVREAHTDTTATTSSVTSSATTSSTSSSSPTSLSSLVLKFAEDVKSGDYVIATSQQEADATTSPGTGNGRSVTSSSLRRVVSISVRTSAGVYAPLTSEGTVVVDGVVVSCYAFFNNEPVAHALFAPMRFLYASQTLLSELWKSSWPYLARLGCLEHLVAVDADHHQRNATAVTRHGGGAGQEGAHWYARLWYSVAVNVVGLDLSIAI